jgi:glycosyltransferase involved in cell wall biosynthesis
MTTPSGKPLVSIIINNYNYGTYLQDAIESALNQSYPAVELIVVDDGSTDNSREIIHSFRDSITGILKPNAGQASAFNTGLALSQGEVVIFLDSDDMLVPGTAEHVVRAFSEHPGTAKVQYRMEIIDAAGIRTGVTKPASHLPVSTGDLRSQILAFPFDLTWMATSGNAFAAQVLRQIFPIPEGDYRILADFYLAHLAPLCGRVVALDQVGAYYRVHGRNSFALSGPTIDLDHVRQMIAYSEITQKHIRRFARQLGLENSAAASTEMLSVSSVAERLISIKLDPERHPVAGDSVGGLFRLGVRAARGRFDASLALKLTFALWFAAMAVAPRPQTRWLAEQFYFPEARGELNRLFGMMHGS